MSAEGRTFERSGSGSHRLGQWILATVALLAIGGWAVPAVMMANRGFAIEDEGSYVLSYRWWHENSYFVTGSQYFYGPVFNLTGHSIPALRLLRLVMAGACNAWFAWNWCRWLEERRRVPLMSRERLVIVLLLTSAGGLAYLWSPLSPGYYDLAADASLMLVATLLAQLRRLPSLPLWIPAVAGVTSAVLVVGKWPAGVVVLLTQLSALAAARREGNGHLARYVGGLTLGLLFAAAAEHLWVMPIGRWLPLLLQVETHPPFRHGLSYLFGSYVGNLVLFAVSAALFAVPSVIAVLTASRVSVAHAFLARAPIVAGALTTGVLIPAALGWRGGAAHGGVMISAVFATMLSAAVAAVSGARGSGAIALRSHGHSSTEESYVALVLLAVPILQAVGTAVPLIYAVCECQAMWVAVIVRLALKDRRTQILPFAVGTNLAMHVVVIALIAGTTTLASPWGTTGFWRDTSEVTGLAGMRVSPSDASEYTALERALAPRFVRDSTPVLTLDRVAGLTYVIGGVPLGATFADRVTPRRSGYLLSLACRRGDVDPGEQPVVLSRAYPPPVVRQALNSCGFAFPRDFRKLTVPGGPPGVKVWVSRP